MIIVSIIVSITSEIHTANFGHMMSITNSIMFYCKMISITVLYIMFYSKLYIIQIKKFHKHRRKREFQEAI